MINALLSRINNDSIEFRYVHWSNQLHDTGKFLLDFFNDKESLDWLFGLDVSFMSLNPEYKTSKIKSKALIPFNEKLFPNLKDKCLFQINFFDHNSDIYNKKKPVNTIEKLYELARYSGIGRIYFFNNYWSFYEVDLENLTPAKLAMKLSAKTRISDYFLLRDLADYLDKNNPNSIESFISSSKYRKLDIIKSLKNYQKSSIIDKNLIWQVSGIKNPETLIENFILKERLNKTLKPALATKLNQSKRKI